MSVLVHHAAIYQINVLTMRKYRNIEFQMNDPAVQADPQQSQAIAEAYAAKEKEIEMRYEKWERLTEA